MKSICIICLDKIFSRMLFLELNSLPLKVNLVCEKLNKTALSLASSSSDLIIYDAEYDKGDLTFIEEVNKPFVVFSNTPISALPENVTHYFEKPFSVSEFLKHISSLLHTENGEKQSITFQNNSYTIELEPFSKQAIVNGELIKFSKREFSLLSLLYKNRGKVVTRREVLDTVWGSEYDEKNNVDNVYVNYLRNKLDKKLGITLICTVRGKGYMMK